jgi:hypothetical protein
MGAFMGRKVLGWREFLILISHKNLRALGFFVCCLTGSVIALLQAIVRLLKDFP